jgi:nucleoside-diphosphate-sugar epimerase
LEQTGYTVSITWDETKPQGVRVRKADMTKASIVLNWEPKVPLREGIIKTIKWFVANNKCEQSSESSR